MLSAELSARNGCGDGNIQAFGSAKSCVVVRNEQAVGDEGTDFRRDAIALVAHDDDAIRGQRLGIDVAAVEQGAVDGTRGLGEQLLQVATDDAHMSQTSHRSLYDLWVVDVSRIGRAVDSADAEPVGNTDDGSYVAWVLHTVERQGEL